MEEGFVIDKGQADSPGTQDWIEGRPEKSFWFGIKTKGRDKHPVKAMRCERCGFLEFYAKTD